jgi:hypothetical protein
MQGALCLEFSKVSSHIMPQKQMLYPHPAVHTTGEHILLHIQLASQQENADRVLNLLSSGSATTVCLIRTMTLGQLVETTCVAMGICWADTKESDQSEVTDVQLGGNQERNKEVRTKVIHCELRIPPGLSPSFKFRIAKNSVSLYSTIRAMCRSNRNSIKSLSSPFATRGSCRPTSPSSLLFPSPSPQILPTAPGGLPLVGHHPASLSRIYFLRGSYQQAQVSTLICLFSPVG